MIVVVTQLLEDQAIGEGEEDTDDSEEDSSGLDDDTPSTVLAFDVIHGGDVCTTQESFIGDVPPKSPKSYNLRSKGTVLNSTLEALLRRILPPTNSNQPSTTSPRGTDDLSLNKSPTSTKGDSPTPRNSAKGVTAKTTLTMQHLAQESSSVVFDYNIIEDLKKTRANISLYEV